MIAQLGELRWEKKEAVKTTGGSSQN